MIYQFQNSENIGINQQLINQQEKSRIFFKLVNYKIINKDYILHNYIEHLYKLINNNSFKNRKVNKIISNNYNKIKT
jgi:hypothetical protein